MIGAASRYRLSLHNAERSGSARPDEAAALRDRAKQLAEQVKAKPGHPGKANAHQAKQTGLGDLSALAQSVHLDAASLEDVLRALSPTEAGAHIGQAGPTSPEAASSTVLDLAAQTGEAERSLLRNLPAGA